MLFTDQALAKRLEAAEAYNGLKAAEALATYHPESGAVAEPIAGGYAIFCGVGSPLTQALGVGMDGPLSASDVERLEHFFESRGAQVQIECCPLGDPTLAALSSERGYRIAEWDNVYFLPLQDYQLRPVSAPGVEVRPALPEEAELWARLLVEGFAGTDPSVVTLLPVGTGLFRMANAVPYIATVDGEPAAVGGLSFYEGVASIFGATTLERFRGRGTQNALLHARLSAAIQIGCTLATSGTPPGTSSHRNMERHGFRVAYTRTKLFKP